VAWLDHHWRGGRWDAHRAGADAAGPESGLAEHLVFPRFPYGSFEQFPPGEAAARPEIDHDFSFTQRFAHRKAVLIARQDLTMAQCMPM
jgi:hypothetical protein